MFDRFSSRSLEVIRLARHEAHLLRSEYAGSEHVLLALLLEQGTAAWEILASLKVDVGAVRAEIESTIIYPCASHAHTAAESLTFTPACSRAFDAAREFSRNFREAEVLPEHILLGLLREKDCFAAAELAKRGIGIDEVYRKVTDRWERGHTN